MYELIRIKFRTSAGDEERYVGHCALTCGAFSGVHSMTCKSRGFTLVEILIVVIILGILAAIVIPQFTNASNDARNNSIASTLQTIRSQIELFKIQHADTPPASAGCLWTVLGGRTSTADTTGTDAATTATFGPYVQ